VEVEEFPAGVIAVIEQVVLAQQIQELRVEIKTCLQVLEVVLRDGEERQATLTGPAGHRDDLGGGQRAVLGVGGVEEITLFPVLGAMLSNRRTASLGELITWLLIRPMGLGNSSRSRASSAMREV